MSSAVGRCARCGDLLTFVGFDRMGQRVTTCGVNLSLRRSDGSPDSVPCNGAGDFVVNGAKTKSVMWWQRRSD